jgi:hypothetical protein
VSNLWPLLILVGLALLLAGIGWWAVRDLFSEWTGQGSHRGASGGGIIGGMVEIDRLVRPSVVHVERVDEEAESDQENDGE